MSTDSINTGTSPVAGEGGIISASAKLSVSEKIGYGLGDAGGTIITCLITSFLTFFYTDVFGLTPAIVGTLFVIPTAAEIPIVQTMMALGMGTAPAVALLMTLPSVSLPSLLMLRKDFDTRVLVSVALMTMLVGVLSGLVGMWLL